ncbi:MAG: DUF4405 domain-containing protein, partial [Candidatus Hydrogenedentes bacterium]|nr:DUF4405 domain-containing protein [Candidatus Hydrogenedentota bacterium]
MSQKPQRRKPFNGRGFISFVLLLSFIVMTVSGVVLYVAPKGRVANWTGWAVWGLDKEEWAALHTVISLLFVVVTPLHIYYNWAVFWNYFKRRFEKGFNLKREFAISVVVCAVFVVGSIWQIPPFHYLTRWNDSIKDYWERVSAHPPVPHAEEWTITELADRTGIAVDVIIARFETEGYHVESPNQTLEDIGYENGVSPKALFAL